MKQTIQNLLQDRGGNYILPFFWQHGETEEVLREYMGAIYDCGIGAVCVEARPHPDYVGPQWWHDMDIILDEARKREMKVWIFSACWSAYIVLFTLIFLALRHIFL